MITTRDRAVVEIVEEAERQKKMMQQSQPVFKANWAAIKKQRYGRTDQTMPPVVLNYDAERMFANVMPDGAWRDRRCFIVGGGESLKNFDFSKLKGELVIGVNRAYEKVDCAIMFAMDRNLYRWITKGRLGSESKEKFEAFKGFRVWLDSAGYNYPKGIHVLQKTGGRALGDSLGGGIGGGTNSGFGALNLAVCLGANPIYLLGFDMKGKWWHKGYPDKHGDEVFGAFINDFKNAVPELRKRGVRVINLNPESALRCFEFGQFKDVEKKIITAITPTGDRLLAFSLCQRWMEKQTMVPDQWIVVDDGRYPLKPTNQMEYIRRERGRGEPKNTLSKNLATAIPYIRGSEVLIIEDDEYYAPRYVERMVNELNRSEVVGIGKSKYYHLSSGGNLQISNVGHASLAQTAFRSSFLPEFSALLKEYNSFLDINLWKGAKSSGRGMIISDDGDPLYVGIKGLPGRAGAGSGHDPDLYTSYAIDKSRQILKKWIPDMDDFDIYMDIAGERLTGGIMQNKTNNNVTGIMACCNAKESVERAYNSVRKFHPDMPIVIIDTSDPHTACTVYLHNLQSAKTKVVLLGYDVGYGVSLHMGTRHVETKYALIFDSGIEMLESPVTRMLKMMEDDTFGVGWVCKMGETQVPYLHPYFQLINIANYRKYRPYDAKRDPCLLTMLDISEEDSVGKIIKRFPRQGKLSKYILHDTLGQK